jgi:regulator of RNase E activity RraB
VIDSPDKKVLEILSEHATPGAMHRVFHYLYFENQHSATSVTAELRNRGFEVTDVRSGAGTRWLVLACHEIAPSEEEIENCREVMEALAESSGGNYDGWEVEILAN